MSYVRFSQHTALMSYIAIVNPNRLTHKQYRLEAQLLEKHFWEICILLGVSGWEILHRICLVL